MSLRWGIALRRSLLMVLRISVDRSAQIAYTFSTVWWKNGVLIQRMRIELDPIKVSTQYPEEI